MGKEKTPKKQSVSGSGEVQKVVYMFTDVLPNFLVKKTLLGRHLMEQAVLLLVALSIGAQPLNAQADQAFSIPEDRWIVFQRLATDRMPLVVSARTGNATVQNLIMNGLMTVVDCQATLANVNNQGMPGELESMYALEDRLFAQPVFLAANAVHVASVTGQGQRRTVIVHSEPLDLTQLLEQAQVPGFSCNASQSENRPGLVELITPTILEIEINRDLDVIDWLQGNGDDGITPRKTNFRFFAERQALDVLIEGLAPYGFFVDGWETEPNGVVLSRIMPVSWSEFRELTPIIVAAAEHSGVAYDGWQTVIISNSPTMPSNN